eukprot:jgi/Psemu1/37772/gm1.37772_g
MLPSESFTKIQSSIQGSTIPEHDTEEMEQRTQPMYGRVSGLRKSDLVDEEKEKQYTGLPLIALSVGFLAFFVILNMTGGTLCNGNCNNIIEMSIVIIIALIVITTQAWSFRNRAANDRDSMAAASVPIAYNQNDSEYSVNWREERLTIPLSILIIVLGIGLLIGTNKLISHLNSKALRKTSIGIILVGITILIAVAFMEKIRGTNETNSKTRNPDLFAFGLLAFLFQATFFSLMILSVVVPMMRTAGEVDNPDSEGSGFGAFIPSNVTDLVRTTQITAILSYMVFADASLMDICAGVEMFPRLLRSDGYDRHYIGRIMFACILRCIQGILAIFAVFLLVMTSSEVIEIILNFTAVTFISALDECAFGLAKDGKYGSMLEVAAKRIEVEPLPRFMCHKHRHVRYRVVVSLLSTMLFGLFCFIAFSQESSEVWVTKTVKVTFEDSTDLGSYSGCYEMVSDSVYSKRHSYNLNLSTPSGEARFGYCIDDRRWHLFYEEEGVVDVNGKNLNDPCRCDEFGNGRCDFNKDIADLNLNKPDFKYDDGDCCAETCKDGNYLCGVIDTAFGVNISSGYGFLHCNNPKVTDVPVVLTFQEIEMAENIEMSINGA